VDIAWPEANYLIKIRMLCITSRSNGHGEGLAGPPAGSRLEDLPQRSAAWGKSSPPRFVDNPEVLSALYFCVRQCNINFQPLERNLIACIVETNE